MKNTVVGPSRTYGYRDLESGNASLSEEERERKYSIKPSPYGILAMDPMVSSQSLRDPLRSSYRRSRASRGWSLQADLTPEEIEKYTPLLEDSAGTVREKQLLWQRDHPGERFDPVIEHEEDTLAKTTLAERGLLSQLLRQYTEEEKAYLKREKERDALQRLKDQNRLTQAWTRDSLRVYSLKTGKKKNIEEVIDEFPNMAFFFGTCCTTILYMTVLLIIFLLAVYIMQGVVAEENVLELAEQYLYSFVYHPADCTGSGTTRCAGSTPANGGLWIGGDYSDPMVIA